MQERTNHENKKTSPVSETASEEDRKKYHDHLKKYWDQKNERVTMIYSYVALIVAILSLIYTSIKI